MMGFHRINQTHRRPYHSPATGRKLGYFSNDANGRLTYQDLNGKTVARVIRFKDGRSPYTDSHPGMGQWVPGVGYL